MSLLRQAPSRRPGLGLAAEPPLPLRGVDSDPRERLTARHVVDAGALLADVPLDAAIARRVRRRGLEPLPAPPARRHDELTSPQTPAGRLRRRLVRDVIRRVLFVTPPPTPATPSTCSRPRQRGDRRRRCAHIGRGRAQRTRPAGWRSAREGLGWRFRRKPKHRWLLLVRRSGRRRARPQVSSRYSRMGATPSSGDGVFSRCLRRPIAIATKEPKSSISRATSPGSGSSGGRSGAGSCPE